MSSRFVNPFTDLGFKIIFGQPASKDLLIILLNELLSGEHHIEDLTFLDKEDRSENIHDKGIIYDLYCRTSTASTSKRRCRIVGIAISWTVRSIMCAVR